MTVVSLCLRFMGYRIFRIHDQTPSAPRFGAPVADVEFDHFTPKLSINTTDHRKANAAFVILVRDNELKQIVESLHQIEDRFNKQYGYNYVFLNEVPFSEKFIKCVSHTLSLGCNANVGVH